MRLLRPLRVTIGLVVLFVLTAGFAAFRGFGPVSWLAQGLARLQFGPSLVALATGVIALGAACLLILLLTFAFGRVYCSTLCPLGLLQDAAARIAAWVRPRRRPRPFARANNWLRYGVLAAVLAAIAGGAGTFAGTLADPYSNFGRIVSGLGRPLAAAANNTLVTPAQALGWQGLYRVTPPWPGPGLLWPALLMLLLVTGLAVWRGRIFCNTLCPVGTVLGLVARYSLFRLTIDRATCTKCATCLRACKAQCLDLRTGVIDASRCVGCFNCLAACPGLGLAYGFAWSRRAATPAPPPPTAAAVANPARRALLAGTVALALAPAEALADPPRRRHALVEGPVAPPGADSVDRFLSRCTACQLCVSTCVTGVLQPALLDYGFAGVMKPRLDFTRAFCNYDCVHCGEVCPTGAIVPLALADKQLTSIGLAHFVQERCIVETDGTDCAACSEHCPTKAVDTSPFRDNLRLPWVNGELCIGCGACEYACPVRPQRAIIVEARPRHAQIRPPRPDRPAPRPASGDFPF